MVPVTSRKDVRVLLEQFRLDFVPVLHRLLIVDEFGDLPFEPDAAHLFFQLVSRRYECGALLVGSSRTVGTWAPSSATRWLPACTSPPWMRWFSPISVL
ncbi:ATP-binding protein [Pararhodobacter sp. CCB-MM2]|uniref:ATP-binding protein n=1 Tax=Pararhodobacter sp. CCB-MM2 TaxID=1786003 RepID=UPI0026F43FEC|nr:ATP-binding protein [Pararhodobacter sp. CCB-MM2]